jgi:hypothetical protein
MAKEISTCTLAHDGGVVWTEEDDIEIEYGKWHQFDVETRLAEEHRIVRSLCGLPTLRAERTCCGHTKIDANDT